MKRVSRFQLALNLEEEIEYTVEKNDTLMMISFKFYGDYSKWRTIQEMNPEMSTVLSVGQVIKLPKPEEAFVWSPSGEPYIIQRGDTLGTISRSKYGTKSKWRKIYENNKPLIKDPNLIFAGFLRSIMKQMMKRLLHQFKLILILGVFSLSGCSLTQKIQKNRFIFK